MPKSKTTFNAADLKKKIAETAANAAKMKAATHELKDNVHEVEDTLHELEAKAKQIHAKIRKKREDLNETVGESSSNGLKRTAEAPLSSCSSSRFETSKGESVHCRTDCFRA